MIFLKRGYVIFLCGAVAYYFLQRGCKIFLWRGCMIFVTHSLRLHNLFMWRFCDFFYGEVAWFFCVERLCNFFVERLPHTRLSNRYLFETKQKTKKLQCITFTLFCPFKSARFSLLCTMPGQRPSITEGGEQPRPSRALVFFGYFSPCKYKIQKIKHHLRVTTGLLLLLLLLQMFTLV